MKKFSAKVSFKNEDVKSLEVQVSELSPNQIFDILGGITYQVAENTVPNLKQLSAREIDMYLSLATTTIRTTFLNELNRKQQ